MDLLSRLEEVEEENIEVLDQVAEIMELLALELKEGKVQEDIVTGLRNTIEKITNIGKEVQDIIVELPAGSLTGG